MYLDTYLSRWFCFSGEPLTHRAIWLMLTLPALGSLSPAPSPPCSHVQPHCGPRDLTLLFVSHAPVVFPLTWDPWECGNGFQSASPHSEGAMLGVNGNHSPHSSPPSARRTLGLLDGSMGEGTSLLLDPQTSHGHISCDLFLSSQASSWQEPPFLSFFYFLIFFPFNACLPLLTGERTFYPAEHGKQGVSFLPVYICFHICFILHQGAF